ncbi:hypothetical protein DL764_001353 [Monosporascus ibericus]|uniref:Zn(2)-C6 fungal-type domain-containing protein n=1 Tax=Monosporascus ibericus TaxID=155417 RepID=A0A4Q4TPS6_9PEZI|nr:hypothetical protein DL764_001353 [Monosporascus ibericus]
MPRPLRTSCDRCHSQKLRCPKEPGIATCTRCLKAGAQCVFSPAGPAARRAVSAVVPVCENTFSFQASVDDGMGTQFDWQQLDFGYALPTTPEITQNGQPETAREAASSGSSTSENSRSAYVRQLTTLATDLDKVYREMPAAPVAHMFGDLPFKEFVSRYTEKYDQERCLEQLFSAGQILIDIYPHVMEILPKETQAVICLDGDCVHLSSDVQCSNQETCQSGGMAAKLDMFLLNLLILCHSRLLDVFGNLLSHAHACAQITTAYPNDGEQKVHVPELRVGNFVASAASSSTMQAVLLTHIASVLKTHAERLGKNLAEALGNGHDDKQSRMLRLQCEILEESAKSRLEELQQVRERLNTMGFQS